MNIVRLLYLINLFVVSCSISCNDKSLVAVVIMVKNEMDVIIPTLKPFVDAGIESFLVFDTGSTDGTQNKVKEYFEENRLADTHIIEEPFIDFSASRNRALDLADSLFSNHSFLIMLDAEWYAHNVDDLIQFCENNKNDFGPDNCKNCYLTRLFSRRDSINNYVIRLIRPRRNVRYTGYVHETIKQEPKGVVSDNFYFEYAPAENGQRKTQERFIRDYNLLKKSYEDNPNNTRTLFYLGQTCQFLNEWDEAIFYYQKRLDVDDSGEERYLAAYRIGCAIEYMIEGVYENKNNYSWDDALRYYLRAHGMIPRRAEPLFRIACYYIRHNEHGLAYLFAARAAELPYPNNSCLFVEKKIYDYARHAVLGQCALYAGELFIGKKAVLHAMSVDNNDPSLQHNLTIYNQYLDSL